jgi:hypothetical protein
VALKGGRFQNRTGGYGLKDAFNEIHFFYLHLSCLELQHKDDLDSLDGLSLAFSFYHFSILD